MKHLRQYLTERFESMKNEQKEQEKALDLSSVSGSKCPNCKEPINTECACLRNICYKCQKPVGNITFTVCDDCWDKEFGK